MQDIQNTLEDCGRQQDAQSRYKETLCYFIDEIMHPPPSDNSAAKAAWSTNQQKRLNDLRQISSDLYPILPPVPFEDIDEFMDDSRRLISDLGPSNFYEKWPRNLGDIVKLSWKYQKVLKKMGKQISSNVPMSENMVLDDDSNNGPHELQSTGHRTSSRVSEEGEDTLGIIKSLSDQANDLAMLAEDNGTILSSTDESIHTELHGVEERFERGLKKDHLLAQTPVSEIRNLESQPKKKERRVVFDCVLVPSPNELLGSRMLVQENKISQIILAHPRDYLEGDYRRIPPCKECRIRGFDCFTPGKNPSRCRRCSRVRTVYKYCCYSKSRNLHGEGVATQLADGALVTIRPKIAKKGFQEKTGPSMGPRKRQRLIRKTQEHKKCNPCKLEKPKYEFLRASNTNSKEQSLQRRLRLLRRRATKACTRSQSAGDSVRSYESCKKTTGHSRTSPVLSPIVPLAPSPTITSNLLPRLPSPPYSPLQHDELSYTLELNPSPTSQSRESSLVIPGPDHYHSGPSPTTEEPNNVWQPELNLTIPVEYQFNFSMLGSKDSSPTFPALTFSTIHKSTTPSAIFSGSVSRVHTSPYPPAPDSSALDARVNGDRIELETHEHRDIETQANMQQQNHKLYLQNIDSLSKKVDDLANVHSAMVELQTEQAKQIEEIKGSIQTLLQTIREEEA